MRASILNWIILILSLLCAAANAYFYLADPNYPPVPGESVWTPVLVTALVYGLFALLGWSQRGRRLESLIVLAGCLIAAALLVFGRGRDWYGSVSIPNYYNQVVRLGSAFGGVGQVVCLVLAACGVLVVRAGRRMASSRRWAVPTG